MRLINKIIIHCSATPEGKDFTASDIQAWHVKRGFNEIGYHFVIGLDGTVERGRNIQRVGAHCLDQNRNSIGICYIGGLAKDGKTPKDTRTEAQKKSLLLLIRELKAKYPRITIHGHNEYAAKDCPCFDVKAEYAEI